MPVTGLLARKVGSTQIFDKEGTVVPVTVLEAGPCPVLEVRTPEKHGYSAVQLGFGERRPKTVTQPMMGHFKKVGLEKPCRFVKEVPVQGEAGVEPGHKITCAMFQEGERVKVTGTSKGRGFAGTVKRHGFHQGPVTHGSRNIRKPGSNGTNTSPGRVWKGKRMAGQYGNAPVTIKRILIVKVEPEKNLLLVRGAVPGPDGGLVVIRKGY